MSKTQEWFSLRIKAIGEALDAYIANMEDMPQKDLIEKWGSLNNAAIVKGDLQILADKIREVP